MSQSSFPPTNDEFLRACFGADADRAHITAFAGDPNTDGQWAGVRWGSLDAGRRDRIRSQNTYFVISTFEDDARAPGRARRTKDLFRAAHVVVVDDVGTKVPLDGVVAGLPAPTWELETSPGNFQWGYVLETPETDAGRVNALLDGLVAAGLAPDGKDPGMKGVTRYVRLPEGVNGKSKYGPDGFTCVMRSWDAGRKFDLDDLAHPLGLVLPGRGVAGTAGTGVARMGQRPPVPAAGDELLGLMELWGMVKGRTQDGDGWDITCPWIDGHTARADTGTACWPGSSFKCHHGHCDGRGWRDLEKWAHERALSEDVFGLGTGLSAWAFGVVPGYVTPGRSLPAAVAPVVRAEATGVAGVSASPVISFPPGAPGAFFAEFIYVKAEDRFFSTRTLDLFGRAAVDMAWTRDLVADLPVVVARTGAVMKPSDWFGEADNRPWARMADRLTYWPGVGVWFQDDEGVGYANKWRAPARLGRAVDDREVGEWLRLVAHVTGREGPGVAELLLDWMALVVGAPGEKPGWHVIVQGAQGVGKDLIAQPMRTGVGLNNIGTTDAISLSGQFNAYAERRLVVVNELTMSGPEQYATLKTLTENTNKVVRINNKNQREYFARNVGAFYVTSNDEKAVAMEKDDRRFLVVMAGTADVTAPWPMAEYQALGTWLDDLGGDAICAQWLWQRWEAMTDARRVVVRGRAPDTVGKAKMIRATEDPLLTYMRDKIDLGAWPDLMTSEDIGADLAGAVRTGAAGLRVAPNPNRWASALASLGGGKVYGGEAVRLKSGLRSRVWAVRNPARFNGMDSKAVAQAYVSAAGNAFNGDKDAANNVSVLVSTDK